MAFETSELSGQVVVGREGGETRIFDRSADGEMVQTLILIVFNSQNLVDRIIKETADAAAKYSISGAAGFRVTW